MKKLTKKDYLNTINETLTAKEWSEGYQFRSSDYFFIEKLNTKATSTQVEVAFTLGYKTKAHHVINNVKWSFPFNSVAKLSKLIDKLELDIMIKTGDPDIKDQVFGKRFNKQRFDELNYSEKGWIIKR